MKNILTIFKKEIRRVFTDRRMVMSLILPGVLIFIIYSIMGQFIAKQVTVDEKYKYEIVIVNYDNNLDPYFGFLTPDKFNITHLTETNDDYLTQLSEKKLDLYIVYPDDFYQKSLNYNSAVDGSGNSPIVKVYHNSAKVESGAAYNLYLTVYLFSKKQSLKSLESM